MVSAFTHAELSGFQDFTVNTLNPKTVLGSLTLSSASLLSQALVLLLLSQALVLLLLSQALALLLLSQALVRGLPAVLLCWQSGGLSQCTRKASHPSLVSVVPYTTNIFTSTPTPTSSATSQ